MSVRDERCVLLFGVFPTAVSATELSVSRLDDCYNVRVMSLIANSEGHESQLMGRAARKSIENTLLICLFY